MRDGIGTLGLYAASADALPGGGPRGSGSSVRLWASALTGVPALSSKPTSSMTGRSSITTGTGEPGCPLSWGTGYLAAELALEQESRRAAVIGSGVAGLTTGRQLQRMGFDVTIYAMAVPPNTTSNMSLASFTPTSGLVAVGGRTLEWDAQFRRAVEIAYKQLQLLISPKYGISWINLYSLMNEMPAAGTAQGTGRLLPSEFRPGRVITPARRASLSVEVRQLPAVHADRALYIPRRPHERLRALRGSHRHPKVRYTPGHGRSGGAGHRQLHGTGFQGPPSTTRSSFR